MVPSLHNELQNNDLKLGSPIFRETPNEPLPNPFSRKQEHHQLLHPVHHEVKSVNHEEKQVNHFKATTLPPSAISNHNSHHTNTKPFLESTTPSTFLGKYFVSISHCPISNQFPKLFSFPLRTAETRLLHTGTETFKVSSLSRPRVFWYILIL